MKKEEIYNEIRLVLADAQNGRDKENVIKRLSVAVTKLDALAEQHPEDRKLREDVRLFDDLRFKVFRQDGQRAHDVMESLKSLDEKLKQLNLNK